VSVTALQRKSRQRRTAGSSGRITAPHRLADAEHGGSNRPSWMSWRYVRFRDQLHRVRPGPLGRASRVRFDLIDARIERQTDLRPADKAVAHHLLRRCKDHLQPTWETQETIAAAVGRKVDTVQHSIRVLHDGRAFDGATRRPLPPGSRALFVVDVCPKVGPVKPNRDRPVSTRPERTAGKYPQPMPRERANRHYPIIEFSELTGNEKKWFLKEIDERRVAPRPVPSPPMLVAEAVPPVADGTVTETDHGPPEAPGPQSREESVALAREALRTARHKSRV
jgi:hypothetical protein